MTFSLLILTQWGCVVCDFRHLFMAANVLISLREFFTWDSKCCFFTIIIWKVTLTHLITFTTCIDIDWASLELVTLASLSCPCFYLQVDYPWTLITLLFCCGMGLHCRQCYIFIMTWWILGVSNDGTLLLIVRHVKLCLFLVCSCMVWHFAEHGPRIVMLSKNRRLILQDFSVFLG